MLINMSKLIGNIYFVNACFTPLRNYMKRPRKAMQLLISYCINGLQPTKEAVFHLYGLIFPTPLSCTVMKMTPSSSFVYVWSIQELQEKNLRFCIQHLFMIFVAYTPFSAPTSFLFLFLSIPLFSSPLTPRCLQLPSSPGGCHRGDISRNVKLRFYGGRHRDGNGPGGQKANLSRPPFALSTPGGDDIKTTKYPPKEKKKEQRENSRFFNGIQRGEARTPSTTDTGCKDMLSWDHQ